MRENPAYSNVASIKQSQYARSKEPPSQPGGSAGGFKLMGSGSSNSKFNVKMMAASTEEKQKHPKSPQKGKCVFCSESHFVERCTKFKGLKLSERMKFAQSEELCFNCKNS